MQSVSPALAPTAIFDLFAIFTVEYAVMVNYSLPAPPDLSGVQRAVDDLAARIVSVPRADWVLTSAKDLCAFYQLPRRHVLWRAINAALHEAGCDRGSYNGYVGWYVPISRREFGAWRAAQRGVAA